MSIARSPSLGACNSYNREFKQIATAGATTAAVTEKVWGEYVSVVGSIENEDPENEDPKT